MRTRLLAVPVLGLAVILLVGCTGEAADPTPTPEETVTVPTPGNSDLTPPDPSPAPDLPTPLTPAPVQPAPTGDETTVSGQVVDGVEAGCLLLRSGATEYLLILPPEISRNALREREVTVRGRVDPSLMTTCQQGTPFIVSEVESG